jgi:hypothetical protein
MEHQGVLVMATEEQRCTDPRKGNRKKNDQRLQKFPVGTISKSDEVMDSL